MRFELYVRIICNNHLFLYKIEYWIATLQAIASMRERFVLILVTNTYINSRLFLVGVGRNYRTPPILVTNKLIKYLQKLHDLTKMARVRWAYMAKNCTKQRFVKTMGRSLPGSENN